MIRFARNFHFYSLPSVQMLWSPRLWIWRTANSSHTWPFLALALWSDTYQQCRHHTNDPLSPHQRCCHLLVYGNLLPTRTSVPSPCFILFTKSNLFYIFIVCLSLLQPECVLFKSKFLSAPSDPASLTLSSQHVIGEYLTTSNVVFMNKWKMFKISQIL